MQSVQCGNGIRAFHRTSNITIQKSRKDRYSIRDALIFDTRGFSKANLVCTMRVPCNLMHGIVGIYSLSEFTDGFECCSPAVLLVVYNFPVFPLLKVVNYENNIYNNFR